MAVVTDSPGPYDDLPACPACGWYIEGQEWEIGGYWICDVCEWEDDPVQRRDPDDPSGANGRSLREWQQDVLNPLGSEAHPGWRPLDEMN